MRDPALIVRILKREQLQQAASLLARGMRDNPNHLAVWKGDTAWRLASLERLFTPVVDMLQRNGQVLGAFRDGELVGVCAMTPPGKCSPSLPDKLRVWASLTGPSPVPLVRFLRWTSRWARHHPAKPHWHLGPIAVEPSLIGQGIGGAMLREFCATVDAGNSPAYLETDDAGNVPIYERYGFSVIGQETVLGSGNWFMERPARTNPD